MQFARPSIELVIGIRTLGASYCTYAPYHRRFLSENGCPFLGKIATEWCLYPVDSLKTTTTAVEAYVYSKQQRRATMLTRVHRGAFTFNIQPSNPDVLAVAVNRNKSNTRLPTAREICGRTTAAMRYDIPRRSFPSGTAIVQCTENEVSPTQRQTRPACTINTVADKSKKMGVKQEVPFTHEETLHVQQYRSDYLCIESKHPCHVAVSSALVVRKTTTIPLLMYTGFLLANCC